MVDPLRKILIGLVFASLLSLFFGTLLEAQPTLPIPANNGPTTSAEFASTITDETGTGLVTLNTNPTINSPTFGGRLSETLVNDSILSGTLVVDMATGPDHVVTNTGNVTSFSIIGADTSATKTNVVTLFVVSNGASNNWTWGGTIKLPNGNPPVFSGNAGATDPLAFVSIDGGATYMMFRGPTF
jgi:hypothetical protein